MESKTDSSKNWLDLGYELFSEEGHEGLQVERLSRILGKNKSGFYHFFGDKDTFLEKLMKMHLAKEEAMVAKLVKLKALNQGFLNLMIEQKQTIMFQTHLVKNRDLKLFLETYSEVNQMIENVVIPIWMKFIGVSQEVATKYWRVIRDSFYARVTSNSFNEEWLSKFVEEAKTILADAKKDAVSK
ncbi:MAG TPA: TetR/AcrR family transcriptional regulator [Algoriphagus sp.]|nr:TetR/AcrR family transcriptional regulator [Algoriphagus sp.]